MTTTMLPNPPALALLREIVAHRAEHRTSPTMRQLGEPGTVSYHVRELRRLGYLQPGNGQRRNLTPTRKGINLVKEPTQ